MKPSSSGGFYYMSINVLKRSLCKNFPGNLAICAADVRIIENLYE
jgi:hypothetical protein